MILEWAITKGQGNVRPVLGYTAKLNEFEVKLGVPAVRIESNIPIPPESSFSHCWPGENERGDWTPKEFHLLMTPSHKTREMSGRLKLPWREGNEYPDVEASFAALRESFELVLSQALGSSEMDVRGRLETSCAMRKTMAPAVATRKILQAVK